MPISEEQITALEAQHKRVHHIKGKNGAWEVVVRKPTRNEYKRFKSLMHSNPSEGLENLARATVVHPDKAGFDALLEEWPGIPEAIQTQMMDLAGVGAAEDEGK